MDKGIIIRNAVLYECAKYLGINENLKSNSVVLLDEVIDFYVKFRDRFKYEVKIPRPDNSDLIRIDNGMTPRKIYNIQKWIEENEIMFLNRIIHNIETGVDDIVYTFAFEEDATAFKLKWA